MPFQRNAPKKKSPILILYNRILNLFIFLPTYKILDMSDLSTYWYNFSLRKSSIKLRRRPFKGGMDAAKVHTRCNDYLCAPRTSHVIDFDRWCFDRDE